MKIKLKEILSKQKFLCLTADAWSSRAQSYLGVTVHFLNADYKRDSYVLAFKQMFCKQTYKELAEAMYEIFKDYNIDKAQITNIVTDGGSNFAKMFKIYGQSIDAVVTTAIKETISNDLDEFQDNVDLREIDDDVEDEVVEATTMSDVNGEAFANEILQFDNIDSNNDINQYKQLEDQTENDLNEASSTNNLESYFGDGASLENEIEMPPQRRCISHLLNLTPTDFQKRLAGVAKRALFQTLNKLHVLWNIIHYSSFAKTTCKKILGLILTSPNETRWNSWFDAVKMCNNPKVKLHLNKLIEQLKSDLRCATAKNLQILTSQDFKVIEQYIKVFEPIAIALDVMQNEKNASQGYIMPVLISMKHRIDQIDDSTSTLTRDFKAAMLSAIDKRFEHYFVFTQCNKDLLLAAVSLPRFKISYIARDDDRIITKSLLIAECKKMAKDVIQIESNQTASTQDDDFIISYSSFQENRRNSIDCEIEAEVSRYLCDTRTENSILKEYSHVQSIYFKFNTTLSSSGPIERVFSQSALIFTPRRNRLSSKNFEYSLLLKHNRQLLNDRL